MIEFLKWSSAGFFTVQLLSNHRSAFDGSSEEAERARQTEFYSFIQILITGIFLGFTEKETLCGPNYTKLKSRTKLYTTS